MAAWVSHPFAAPQEKLPIRHGAPPLRRPGKHDGPMLAAEATEVVEEYLAAQTAMTEARKADLQHLADRDVLVVGGTGSGIGGAISLALLNLGSPRTLTVISRDLRQSKEFYMGELVARLADNLHFGNRFWWSNEGVSSDGAGFDSILEGLKSRGAQNIVYFNCVAAASSGVREGFPEVFVKDIDDGGLFQWRLPTLTDREVHATTHIMGTMATAFPRRLAANGVTTSLSIYADWRGSLDVISRDPSRAEYGRQGPYSTSLFLPKDVIQAEVRSAFGTAENMIDIFYPMMRTRALRFIPGGHLGALLNSNLMRRESIREKGVPELAVESLAIASNALRYGVDNPFPRLDASDAALIEWYYEVLLRLTNDESSPFFFRYWV